MIVCQVNDDPKLKCPVLENQFIGYQCEVEEPHTYHVIGDHTIWHALKGNGYSCASIELMLLERRLEKELPNGFSD